MVPNGLSDADLVAAMDEDQIEIGARQRRQLDFLAEFDKRDGWRNSGARDMAGWISARYGVSPFRAKRMVAAGHALQSLPVTAKALESGRLNIERVVELVRIATPETEADLVKWARRVTSQWIAHKADLTERKRTVANKKAENARYLDWTWLEEGLQFQGLLPTDVGKKFVATVSKMSEQVECSPDQADDSTLPTRRADALAVLVTEPPSEYDRPDQALVVVHAQLPALLGHNLGGGELDEGTILHPDVVRRLVCDGRIELVLHDEDGKVRVVGTETYQVPRWLRRQVLRRDAHRCTFPGCHARRFIDVHHIVSWPRGATEIDNLTCLCRHHHKLVHEHGWRVRLTKDDRTEWFRPNGDRYDPAPVRAGPDGPTRTFRTSDFVFGSVSLEPVGPTCREGAVSR